MKKIILSICIPTYNRGEYIGEALESVLNQITPDIQDKVEICISDNASTDNTEILIKEYQEKNICKIIYHKNEENIGADRNFLKVIDIANGEYCWYLGSDDTIEDNILTKLINIISSTKIDFYLLTQNCYDITLTKNKNCNNHELLKRDDGILTIDELLTDSIYLLGFISVLIVKKEIFIKKEPLENKYMNSHYIHMYKILSALNNGSNIYFIREPMIKWRADNDSFLNDLKIYGRIKIDIDGYSSIASDVFGEDSIEYKKIIKIRIINNIARHVFLLRLNNIERKNILELYNCIKKEKRYFFIVKIISLIPKKLILLFREIYRNTIK